MPQWGKGVQGWVNGWVNINNKYSNYTISDDADDEDNSKNYQTNHLPKHHHYRAGPNEKDEYANHFPQNHHENYHRGPQVLNEEYESTTDDNNNIIYAPNLHGPLHRRVPYPGPGFIGDGRAILNQRIRPPHNYHPSSTFTVGEPKGNYAKTPSFKSVATADTTAVSSQSYAYDTTHYNAGDVMSPGFNNHLIQAPSAPKSSSSSTNPSNTPTITRPSGYRRGLRRTNSHSDLIKKKATDKRTAERTLFPNDKNTDNHQHKTNRMDLSSKQSENNSASSILVSETSGSTGVTLKHSNSIGDSHAQVQKNINSHLEHIRIQSTETPVVIRRASAPEPSTTGQYINEAAFASQQYQIQMRAKQQLSQLQEQTTSTTMATTTANSSGPPAVKDVNIKGKKKREKVKTVRRKKKDNNKIESLPVPAPVPIVENNLPVVSESGTQLYYRQTYAQPIPDPHSHPNARPSYPPGTPITHIHPHMIPPNSKSMVIPFESTLEEENDEHHGAPQVAFCTQCDEMERHLLALQADVEYLRATSLQSEYICAECENQVANSSQVNAASSSASVASGKASVASSKRKHKKHRKLLANPDKLQESIALAEASQRLVDVNARHKRQIEQMTRETARWQNDMHMKLSKLSMMCKDLNDEAGKRKEESNKAQTDLQILKDERDSMASEVNILKARVEIYEKQAEEESEIRRIFREGQNEALDIADEEISKRDKIIEELTEKLQHTLETLDLERRLTRQRRQIIFPSRN